MPDTERTLTDDIRDARSHTNRIRKALRELPAAIAAEGWNLDLAPDEKRRLHLALSEILGSASAIAEICDVEI